MSEGQPDTKTTAEINDPTPTKPAAAPTSKQLSSRGRRLAHNAAQKKINDDIRAMRKENETTAPPSVTLRIAALARQFHATGNVAAFEELEDAVKRCSGKLKKRAAKRDGE